jgi:hypothetical protein
MLIFNSYFRIKILLFGALGVIAATLRIICGLDTPIVLFLIIVLLFVFIGFIISCYDFYVQEFKSRKQFDNSILEPFLKKNHFVRKGRQIMGNVNKFNVIISPMTSRENENSLMILIAAKFKDGLERYFTGLDENFTLTRPKDVLFAQAILKNYTESYDYQKLHKLIEQAINNLRSKGIEPLLSADTK